MQKHLHPLTNIQISNLLRRLVFVFISLFIITSCSQPIQTVDPTSTPSMPYRSTIFNSKVAGKASITRVSDERPNIIVILTDDQPPSSLQFLPTIKNRLMGDGVVFEKGFVTTPLCCPSRASILCGEYAHNHNIKTDRAPLGGATKFDDTATLAVALQAQGYLTGYIGKYLNEYNDIEPKGKVPPGWSDWQVLLDRNNPMFSFYYDFTMSENGKIVRYPKDRLNYSTDLITQKSVDFIGTNKDKPFFLFVGYFGPHSPYTPALRHKNEFRTGSSIEWIPNRPPSLNEEDISDKPAFLKDMIKETPIETIDAAHKQVLRSLLSVDDGVASILSELDQAGLTNNTIIFFLSDNGLTLGEHRFGLDKNCAYDECSHIPYIVYGPGYFQPTTNTKNIVANIDIYPTVIELAGGTVSKKIDGESLVPLLKQETTNWRDAILIEHWPDDSPDEGGIVGMIPEFYAIRTDHWKYVEYQTGETELYDLEIDPFEMENLAGNSKYSSQQKELHAKLLLLKSQ